MNASLLSSVFRSGLAPHSDPMFTLNRVPAFSSFPLTYFFCHLRPEVLFKSVLTSVMNSLSRSFIVDKYIGIHSRITPEWFLFTLRTSSPGFGNTKSCKHACVMLVKRRARLRCGRKWEKEAGVILFTVCRLRMRKSHQETSLTVCWLFYVHYHSCAWISLIFYVPVHQLMSLITWLTTEWGI